MASVVEYFDGMKTQYATGYGHAPVKNSDISRMIAADIAASPISYSLMVGIPTAVGAITGGFVGAGIGQLLGAMLISYNAGMDGSLSGIFNDYASIKSKPRQFWDKYNSDLEALKDNGVVKQYLSAFAASASGTPAEFGFSREASGGNLYGDTFSDITDNISPVAMGAGAVSSFIINDLLGAVGLGSKIKGFKYLSGAEMAIAGQLTGKDARQQYLSELSMGTANTEALSSAALHGAITGLVGVAAPSAAANLFHYNLAPKILSKVLPARVLESAKLMSPIERFSSGLIEGSTFLGGYETVEQPLKKWLTNDAEESGYSEMAGLTLLGFTLGALSKPMQMGKLLTSGGGANVKLDAEVDGSVAVVNKKPVAAPTESLETIATRDLDLTNEKDFNSFKEAVKYVVETENKNAVDAIEELFFKSTNRGTQLEYTVADVAEAIVDTPVKTAMYDRNPIFAAPTRYQTEWAMAETVDKVKNAKKDMLATNIVKANPHLPASKVNRIKQKMRTAQVTSPASDKEAVSVAERIMKSETARRKSILRKANIGRGK